MGPEGSKGRGEMQLNYNLKNEKKENKVRRVSKYDC